MLDTSSNSFESGLSAMQLSLVDNFGFAHSRPANRDIPYSTLEIHESFGILDFFQVNQGVMKEVGSYLEENFPSFTFTKTPSKIIVEPGETKSDFSQNQRLLNPKNENMSTEKAYLALTKKLRELGINSSASKNGGSVYYISSPKDSLIALCNIDEQLMTKVKKTFSECFSETFSFEFTAKSVKYSLKSLNETVQSNAPSLPEKTEKSASQVIYKSIVGLLSFLDDSDKDKLVSLLSLKAEFSKEELVEVAKKHGLLVIEGGKLL